MNDFSFCNFSINFKSFIVRKFISNIKYFSISHITSHLPLQKKFNYSKNFIDEINLSVKQHLSIDFIN